jgi:hypothetical protein
MPFGSSLTGNFQKTNKPKIIKIRDITQETAGLFMLNSVINIYLLIGLIFPRGRTFFKPSATTVSPSLRPEIISIFLLFRRPVFTSVLLAIFSSLTL